MLLIYGNHESWDALDLDGGAKLAELGRIHAAVLEELTATGELIDSEELSVADACVVRTTKGVPTVTDGPFIETKEIVGGYYLIDCADRDRAVSIAGRFAEAEFSIVEVRRIRADS